MIRPEIIYLDKPVTIDGISVPYTYQGAKYLAEHYEHCMRYATAKQMDDNARQHCTKLIENINLRIQLYEKRLCSECNRP